MPRVPFYPIGVEPAVSRWMTLAEAVQWVAYGYGPKPKYGSEVLTVIKDIDPEGSTPGYNDWTTHTVWVGRGDLSDWVRADDGSGYLVYSGDLENLQNAAAKVHAALEDGQLIAWGQNGHEKSEKIDPPDWAQEHYRLSVSWISLPDPYNRVTVKRSDVMALWPTDPDPNMAGKQEAAPQTKQKRGRGRTKGSGSYTEADGPLLAEMRQLIAEQVAFSPDGAAKMVADKAKGGGTAESRASRLARSYRKTEQN